MSDTNYICKVCGSRRRLSRTRHHQEVPKPRDLLSTLVTWKGRQDKTQDIDIDLLIFTNPDLSLTIAKSSVQGGNFTAATAAVAINDHT